MSATVPFRRSVLKYLATASLKKNMQACNSLANPTAKIQNLTTGKMPKTMHAFAVHSYFDNKLVKHCNVQHDSNNTTWVLALARP